MQWKSSVSSDRRTARKPIPILHWIMNCFMWLVYKKSLDSGKSHKDTYIVKSRIDEYANECTSCLHDHASLLTNNKTQATSTCICVIEPTRMFSDHSSIRFSYMRMHWEYFPVYFSLSSPYRFFHAAYEEEFGRVKGHFGPINCVAFHPDGKRCLFYFISSFKHLDYGTWFRCLQWESLELTGPWEKTHGLQFLNNSTPSFCRNFKNYLLLSTNSVMMFNLVKNVHHFKTFFCCCCTVTAAEARTATSEFTTSILITSTLSSRPKITRHHSCSDHGLHQSEIQPVFLLSFKEGLDCSRVFNKSYSQ